MCIRDRSHPDIMQASVIGVAHPKWDERPLLLVVPANDKKDKESIYSFLEDKIAKWWKPDDIVFVDELPIGATGKVLKIELNSILQKSHLHDCLINFQDDYDIEFVNEDVSPGINLPDSFDEYLSLLQRLIRN